jgi:hypothetical protein
MSTPAHDDIREKATPLRFDTAESALERHRFARHRTNADVRDSKSVTVRVPQRVYDASSPPARRASPPRASSRLPKRRIECRVPSTSRLRGFPLSPGSQSDRGG